MDTFLEDAPPEAWNFDDNGDETSGSEEQTFSGKFYEAFLPYISLHYARNEVDVSSNEIIRAILFEIAGDFLIFIREEMDEGTDVMAYVINTYEELFEIINGIFHMEQMVDFQDEFERQWLDWCILDLCEIAELTPYQIDCKLRYTTDYESGEDDIEYDY